MDRWEERVTGCGTAVAGVLELSKVYFEHFNKIEIAGSKIRRNNASLISDNRPSNLRGSAQRRIARVSTAFALSAALVEIDDLTNHKHQKSLIIERVLDTFFRGRDRDIDDCLDAMTELSLVEKHDDNIMEKKRHYRKFTPKYVEFLKDYTESVVTTVTGMETVLGQKWRQTARIVFDFYRFRYIPEWYLLIRRILRSSARHRNKMDSEQYSMMFEDANVWFGINLYLTWYAKSPEHDRTIASFESYVSDRGHDADVIIEGIMDMGLCIKVDERLTLDDNMIEHVAEYAKNVTVDYENFVSTIHRSVDLVQNEKELDRGWPSVHSPSQAVDALTPHL